MGSPAPALPRRSPTNYAGRDYFTHFFPEPRKPDHRVPRDEVYVSRAYHSMKDGTFKIAVSTRIWEEDGDRGRCLGVLVANIPFGPKLVAVDMKLEDAGAKVISPTDWSYAPSLPPSPKPSHVVVLDRSYPAIVTEKQVQYVVPGQFLLLDKFDRHQERESAMGGFWEGAVTDAHRVGKTSLVVVQQRPYPWPLRLDFDPQLRRWAVSVPAIPAFILLLLVVARRVPRWIPARRRHAPAVS